MGTDIHLYVERREGSGRERSWRYATPPFPRVWDRDDREMMVEMMGEDHLLESIDVDRNYDLFAVLANVRNGYGTAGCDTGDGLEPLSLPRGLPEDLSAEMLREWVAWGEHTPSWLLLSEIERVGWDDMILKKRGIVGVEEFQRWLATRRRPDRYSGGISGNNNVRRVTNEEMSELVKKGVATPSDYDQYGHPAGNRVTYYTEVAWIETYRQACGPQLFEEILPAMRAMGDPEDVRAVFWFDS